MLDTAYRDRFLEQVARDCIEQLNQRLRGGFWLRMSPERRQTEMGELRKILEDTYAVELQNALERMDGGAFTDDDHQQTYEALRSKLITSAKALMRVLLKALPPSRFFNS